MPTVELTAGEHEIKFVKDGYETLLTRVDVTDSGISCISVESGGKDISGGCGSSTPPGVVVSGYNLTAYLQEKPKRPCPCGSYGDFDGDGFVSEEDEAFIAFYITFGWDQIKNKLSITEEEFKKRADVNGDGVVNEADQTLINDYREGRIDTFPVCEEITDICSWIQGKGGPSAIGSYDITQLILAYIGIKDLGFEVTSAQIAGVIMYYIGNTSSGDALTGCGGG